MDKDILACHVRITRLQCHKNAQKYGYTKQQADKCDEVNDPICKCCPFITK